MDIDFGKLVKNISEIKLKGGLFQKACTVIIIVCISILTIALVSKNLYVEIGAIVLIFLFAFILVMRLINFANKNPQAALLEGAQFLVHEQIQLAAKGIGEIPQIQENIVEGNPVIINDETIENAEQPDEQIQEVIDE